MMDHEQVNILLVDDQPAKLLAYEVILKELGENLIVAASGREALEILLKNEIAIILVDVCMPELDGFELAAMIREHPRFQKTAMIFISAIQVSDIDRLRGYEMGAVDYVPVPVVPEALRARSVGMEAGKVGSECWDGVDGGWMWDYGQCHRFRLDPQTVVGAQASVQ